LVVLATLLQGAQSWLVTPIPVLTREIYGANPFQESAIVAKFIRENSSATARVAVLGSEPEIYFLARRHSATGYIYAYPLMESQPFASQMQREMVDEIQTRKPEFIVAAASDLSWSRQAGSAPAIFEWWHDYRTNYTRVGLVDTVSPVQIVCVFGASEAARYGASRGSALEIFQRK
jgi:hypothetical protein